MGGPDRGAQSGVVVLPLSRYLSVQKRLSTMRGKLGTGKRYASGRCQGGRCIERDS
jgi:hypothetical protein